MRARGFVLLLTCAAATAQPPNPGLKQLIDEVRREIRSDEQMEFMRRVYANDRYFTFPRFELTANYLQSQMKQIGLEDVQIVNAPADGKTQVGFWTMPLAWDVKSAQLEVLDDSLPAASRVLADYGRIPASLGMWSGPTPAEGITAEVVAFTRGRFADVDLRGKFALTDENPANIKSLLVKAGAVGAINTFTENRDLRDGRQWINAWGDSGWAYTNRSTPLLSFSVSPRQDDLLRQLLQRGPVRVKATVDTRYYTGSYPYVTALIPGSGPEEVLTLGHMAEQGAHDNATGVAATLEALALLNRLIAAGKLPPPKRAIRILVMGEMYGSMHYVEQNRDRIRRTVAAICIDTPAAFYELAGTEYSFYMNPHVAKDFTDAFILKIASDYFPGVRRPWHEKPFTTGTDTYLAEPMVGVPTVWGYSGSGVESHHNSEDTPDRVDARSLRDITVVDAAFLYFLANAGEPEALWLAGLSESRGYEQILKAAASLLDRGSPDLLGAIGYAVERESQSVLSVLRLVPEDRRAAMRTRLVPLLDRLSAFGKTQSARLVQTGSEPAQNLEASRIVVKRKRFGTIPLDDLPRDQWEGQPSGAWAAIPTIALYWCDGRRTLAEVSRFTQLELGRTAFDFVRYFRFLEKRGYVEFVN